MSSKMGVKFQVIYKLLYEFMHMYNIYTRWKRNIPYKPKWTSQTYNGFFFLLSLNQQLINKIVLHIQA